MGWREQLKPAAFRGVGFDVMVTDGQLGRRVALHEYPGRDTPWVEDLGRRARVFSVDAVIVGTDYIARRDALIAALERPGAGKLEHPTFGEMQVTLSDCRVAESTAEGGAVRFSLVFVEAGAATWPRASTSTPDQVAKEAAPALKAAKDAFATRFPVKDQPDFIANSAASMVTDLAAQVQEAGGARPSDADALADLSLQADDLLADPVGAAYEPESLADSVAGLIVQLARNTTTTPGDAFAASQGFWRFGVLSVDTTGASPKRQIEMNNQVEFARLVRAVAITEAGRALAGLSFDSYDQAVALRDEFADVVDELLLATADDGVFDALRALRAAVVADVTARGADLSRLARYTPAGVVPALLVAQQLYADGSRGDEVLQRNQALIAHPLFVRGGVALEVLADA